MSPPDASPRKIFIVTSAISRTSCRRADRGRSGGLVFAEQCLELGRDLRRGLDADLDRVATLLRDDDLLPPRGVGLREVLAGVTTAALFACQRRPRDGHRTRELRADVERGVPRRVVRTPALRRRALRAHRKRVEPHDRLLELAPVADDADERLHGVLQLRLDRVRVLSFVPLERRGEVAFRACDLLLVEERHAREALGVFGRIETRAAPEDDQVRERVPAETVRAVKTRRALARREESWDRRLLRVRVDL